MGALEGERAPAQPLDEACALRFAERIIEHDCAYENLVSTS